MTPRWSTQLDDYVTGLAWSPDGARLAASSAGGGIALFDHPLSSGAHLGLPGHRGGTNSVAWSPDGNVLASGGQDGRVRLWNAPDGSPGPSVEPGGGWIEQVCRAQAGPGAAVFLATSGREAVAVNPADGAITHRFGGHPKSVNALAWHPGGNTFAAAYFGGVDLWDFTGRSRRGSLHCPGTTEALLWSPDGRWLVSGMRERAIHLWVPPHEDEEFHMSGYEGRVRELAFDPSGRLLAAGGGAEASIWNCDGAGPAGTEPLLLPHIGAAISALAFQNRSGRLASGDARGDLLLWAPDRRQPLLAQARTGAEITCLAWHPDDRHLAAATAAGGVLLFET